MREDAIEDSVTKMVMAVRHRQVPSEENYQDVLRGLDKLLGKFDDETALPKGVVRTLLDLVSMILMHAPDSPDEQRVLDMYMEINELLMRKVP